MQALATIVQDTNDPSLFTCIMTREVCDRDGEVILLDGIDFKNYERNPVIMFEHGKDGKAGKIPVGKALSANRVGDMFEAKVKFASRPDNHPVGAEWLPDTLASLVDQKCLNCVSIGFIELASRKATAQDRVKYGANTRKVITKADLFELSVTGVPCNQEALVTARGKGLLPVNSDAYVSESQPERRGEVQKVKVPVVLKSQKTVISVDISPVERIKEIVMVRVKGGLYA